MRRRSSRPRRHALIEPNLTSLIDVTFLLIVFFVLVSRLNEAESFTLDLPSPREAATVVPDADDQVAVSVVPGAGGVAAGYRVGAEDFAADEDGLNRLAAYLVSLYRTNPRINLNLRADRGTHFDAVEPMIAAVSKAIRQAREETGREVTPRVNLMVMKEQ